MATIPLTQGKAALVDDDMVERLLVMGKWCLSNNGYAVRWCNVKRGITQMHRVILELAGFGIAGLDVDHRNGDRLDNRLENLRPSTRSQNKANSGCHTDNRSGYRGVSWETQTGKWRSQLTIRGARINLGRFNNPIDAALAYDAAAREHFGDFARPNFENWPWLDNSFLFNRDCAEIPASDVVAHFE